MFYLRLEKGVDRKYPMIIKEMSKVAKKDAMTNAS
jgi:hypothetical protein